MGKKIFISYKYADNNVYPISNEFETTVRTYVDNLEEYFDESDNIYKGESDNEDLSDLSEETIWNKLKDRIFDSTITIVMISPNMKEEHRKDKSQWIPWEISFSLKETTRNDRTSHSNAILAIALPDKDNSYKYIIEENEVCNSYEIKTNVLFNILKNNIFNKKNPVTEDCNGNKIYSVLDSYIQIVKWSEFISITDMYLDIAEIIQSNFDEYNIEKNV